MGRALARAGFLLAALAAGCAELHPADEGEADAGARAADDADGGVQPQSDAGASGDASVDERPPEQDAGPPPPEEIVTVLGAGNMVDTYVRLANPTFNYGVTTNFCADTTGDDRRILMRFDVSDVGAATVKKATLRLWTGTSVNDYSTQLYTAYEMLEAWSEGTQSAAAGVASWNQRSTNTAWKTAGAGLGSRDDAAIGSFTPAVIDSEYTVEIDPAVVNGWVADAASNFGIVILSAGADGACFYSSEHATVAKRPSLTVVWTE
ncbi:MAG TPA: DNRLRE domain-containing protein [Kofleriaceae bacterium]|nr:DNRLRE domain-containing protein [Kofleriaceae bacterium]